MTKAKDIAKTLGVNTGDHTVVVADLVSAVAVGASGNVLTSDGTTWTSAVPTGGGGGGATATYTRTNPTVTTALQTSFSVTYVVGFIAVYLNGVLLNAADYTATTGTTVVLTVGAATTDIIEFIAYNTSTVAITDASTLATGIAAAARLGSGTANSTTFLKGNNTWVLPTLTDIPGAWTKKAVDCATTAALTLNTAQVTIDGITLSATSRVLVKNQATASQNGIYTGMTTTTWNRDIDADASGEIAGGTVSVDAGTTQFGQLWTNNFLPTATLDTTAMNWFRVLDSSQNIVLPVGTAAVGGAPLKFTPSATFLTTPEAGAIEVDSVNSVAYFTGNTTAGRGLIPTCQYFRLAANLAVTATTISPFFGTVSSIPLVANGIYEIEFFCVFLKNTTTGTNIWTFTNSAVVTNMVIQSEMSPLTGATLLGAWGAPLTGVIATQTIVGVALPVTTGNLTIAVNHYAKFKVILENASSTSLRLNITQSAGTVTPLRGSYWKATRIANAGILAT